MRIPRLVLFTVLALVLAIVFISNVFGQTYKRHALIEESTGTWCQYCPFGAYLIDSAEKKMKDYAVVISYHGPLGTQNDPMWIAQADTMNDNYPSASSGYPWAVIGRDAATSNRNLWDAQAEFDAGEAPLVDFRVVNATFNSSNHSVDFDLDITPIVLGQTPTEDTATFVVIAAVTEDGIVAPQELNGVGTIDNFVHHNVARAFGSKVMGDAIVLGTKTSVSWPVRKHYHISTSDKGVNDFVQDSIRIKAFVARRSKTASNGEVYLDAGQTTYITKLPSNATRSVWPVLPQAGQMVSGTTMPVVWGRGGGAASSVKIEYSLDNGTTWNLVVASTNTSPYQWALPDTVFGQNLVLRVTDAQDASLDSTTGVFSIAPKPYFTVEYPKTNDTLWVGDTVHINWTSYGASENVTLEYSTDGSTWSLIKAVSAVSTYQWIVPAGAEGASVIVRVRDANGALGTTGAFSVFAVGAINSVTLDGGPNFSPNEQTTVHWTASGFLGKSLRIQVLNNSQTPFVWQGLAAGVDPTLTQLAVTMPGWTATQTKVRILSNEIGSVIAYSTPFDITTSSDVAPVGSNANHVTISPDPLSNSATVSFNLPEAASATLILHDLLGREVLRLAPGGLPAGQQTLTLDASNLAAGTYTYTLIAGQTSIGGKLVVVH